MQIKTLRPWNSHRLTAKLPTPPAPANAAAAAAAVHKADATAPATTPASEPTLEKKRRRPLRPLKAAISIKPAAVAQLHRLLASPTPQLIRIGVRNRGCSGLIYHLEYVSKPGQFDEEVVQDGVKVLIDSKALFSVIGSDMDYVDDGITSKFVFNNPNSKGSCGCGESFMV